MPVGPAKSTRVAIVGASSLRGRELKLVLEERNFPASDIVLLDEPALAGTLTEAGGEPTFIRALSEDSFEDARFVFFAGSQQDAVRNWPSAQSSGATVIDLTCPRGSRIFPPRAPPCSSFRRSLNAIKPAWSSSKRKPPICSRSAPSCSRY